MDKEKWLHFKTFCHTLLWYVRLVNAYLKIIGVANARAIWSTSVISKRSNALGTRLNIPGLNFTFPGHFWCLPQLFIVFAGACHSYKSLPWNPLDRLNFPWLPGKPTSNRALRQGCITICNVINLVLRAFLLFDIWKTTENELSSVVVQISKRRNALVKC